VVFLVVGVGFKLGAVPFHMWVPDVYQGAPTAITLFLASAPKLAGVRHGDPPARRRSGTAGARLAQMLGFLALLSMVIGNLVAIAQTNLKRMLAYSTISHVGFVMLGIMSGTDAGMAAAMFYAITYALMTTGAFGMIIALSQRRLRGDKIDDFKGLNQRNPWFAFLMLLIMGSLAGFPPLVGFFSKLYVLQAAINAGMDVAGDRRRRDGGDRRLLLPAHHQGHVLRRARARTRAAGTRRCARGAGGEWTAAAGPDLLRRHADGVVRRCLAVI
jgi:NADH-quinone oxidoreductase subunit N